jgi:hypothetical protein
VPSAALKKTLLSSAAQKWQLARRRRFELEGLYQMTHHKISGRKIDNLIAKVKVKLKLSL